MASHAFSSFGKMVFDKKQREWLVEVHWEEFPSSMELMRDFKQSKHPELYTKYKEMRSKYWHEKMTKSGKKNLAHRCQQLHCRFLFCFRNSPTTPVHLRSMLVHAQPRRLRNNKTY